MLVVGIGLTRIIEKRTLHFSSSTFVEVNIGIGNYKQYKIL